MTFSIDTALLPATLTAHPMSDQEFAELCADHPDLMFEMSSEGELVVTAPTNPGTGVRNSYLNFSFVLWARGDGRGVICDSSSTFVLPNGARHSPDVSWTLKSRVEALKLKSFDSAWHLCPDFVLELKSPSDRLRTLHAKMQEYMENGAQLGWLIDPETRSVTIHRPNQSPETFTNIDSLTATEPLTGFTLDLAEVWNPLQ